MASKMINQDGGDAGSTNDVVLKFRHQMRHQLTSLGMFSPQVNDYTSQGLIKHQDESREAALRTMMDSFRYRTQSAPPPGGGL